MPDIDSTRLLAINHFANRLIPEAFERPYSAYDISLVDAPASFDDWVADRIDEALTFEYPFGGRATGMIQVERAGLRGTWHGCTYPGCRLETESKNVRDEVAGFDQPWMFAIDTWGPDEQWIEVEDEHTGLIEDVLTCPRPRWRAPWYAEARGRGTARTTSGVIHLDLWERVGEGPLPPGTRFEKDARRVLNGHPDRRRYRLR